MNWKKAKKAWKNSRERGRYVGFMKQPVQKQVILMEAAHGRHLNGNIAALLSCLLKEERWAGYTPYVSVAGGEEDLKRTRQLLEERGLSGARPVLRESMEYRRLLATAGVLITDNSFPAYFIRREGQVYLNTWHGTPLKRLGRSDIKSGPAIGNVQKNFLAADYLLFPNEYTREVMMEDYMIHRIYRGKSLVIDYPRNDPLHWQEQREKTIADLGLEGKKVIAYMPTWRGSGRSVDEEGQVRMTQQILRDISAGLAEEEILYVNLHFLVSERIDLGEFDPEKVRLFPPGLETYEFLSACDVLISDYSSVMMDFAQTSRDVIMFMYDYEEYEKEKGFYFDIRQLPFRKARTAEELIGLLHEAPEGYEMEERFRGDHMGEASRRVWELLLEGKEDGLQLTANRSDPDLEMLYIGDLEREPTRRLADRYLGQMGPEEKKKTVIGYESEMSPQSVEYLCRMDPDFEFIPFVAGGAMEMKEYVALRLFMQRGQCASLADRYFRREFRHLFQGTDFAKIRLLVTDQAERIGIIGCHPNASFCRIPLEYYSRIRGLFEKHPRCRSRLTSNYKEFTDYPEKEDPAAAGQ